MTPIEPLPDHCGSVRPLRIVEEDCLTDFDRRWMPATLRYAANVVMRENAKEHAQARRLRLLADELALDQNQNSTEDER